MMNETPAFTVSEILEGYATANMSQVEAKPVEWIWHPYIPKSKVTLLEGDPGLGKSFITLAIATAIGLGRTPGPRSQPLENGPGRVLLLTAEDALDDTIRPRLDQMLADVETVTAVIDDVILDEVGLKRVERTIQTHDPVLVVIDPLVAFLSDETDTHNDKSVRRILKPLAKIADDNQVAILGVRHLAKSGNRRAITAGGGSIGFTAAARSVLLVGEYDEQPDTDTQNTNKGRCLIQTKNNLAKEGPAIGYTLSEETGFQWGSVLNDITSADLLHDKSAGRPADKAAAAKTMLLNMFEGEYTIRADDIYAAGKHHGISNKTLKRAKKELGIEAERAGYGSDGGWYWILPNGIGPSKEV